MTMDAAEAAEFSALLAELRAELLAAVATDDARLAAVRAARSDANDDDEHDPEGATLSAEWSRAEGLRSGVVGELEELARAQQRMADGSYGICEGCGLPIPRDRLRVRPAARLCVACAGRSVRPS